MLINIWEERIIYEWEDKKGYEKTEARNSMMVGNCSQNIMVNIEETAEYSLIFFVYKCWVKEVPIR